MGGEVGGERAQALTREMVSYRRTRCCVEKSLGLDPGNPKPRAPQTGQAVLHKRHGSREDPTKMALRKRKSRPPLL